MWTTSSVGSVVRVLHFSTGEGVRVTSDMYREAKRLSAPGAQIYAELIMS